MTISRKLYLSFGSILAILVVLFIVSTVAATRERSARANAAAALEQVQTIESIRYQMMRNRLYLRNYLLSGDTKERTAATTGAKELADFFVVAKSRVRSDSLREAIAEVEAIERSWTDEFFHPLIDKRRAVDAGDATAADLQVFYLQRKPGSYVSRSTALLDEANQDIRKSMQESIASSDQAAFTSSIMSTVGTLLAILLGVGVAFYTARSINRPLEHLIHVARQVGDQGDLEQNIEVDRDDEIGALAKTFRNMVTYLKEMAGVSAAVAEGNLAVEIQLRSKKDTLAHAFSRMAEGLQEIVRQVRDTASQVSSGAHQVAGASDETARNSTQASSAIDEITSTMHEMSINVQNVVKSTQVQAASVSETSASIDQMVASIQRVADTAKVLLDISQRSREEVQTGMVTMQKATEGLNQTGSTIRTSSEIIGVLGRRAEDIGRIIEVIDDLAEQTNLLALNAAIEAARAGEHGLGFAVVADEVRKLAEKSTQSTREISELIQSIQKEAREAVDTMKESNHVVDAGLTMSKDLQTALAKIANVVGEVNKFAQEIGAATHEQSHGSTQIAKATTRLTELTQEISSSVEEQATGIQAVVRAMDKMREMVQQSSSSSTELAAAADQMAKLSRNLMEAMDRFHLAGGNGHGRKPGSARLKPEREEGELERYGELVRS